MASSASLDQDLERCQQRVGSTVRGKWHIDRLLGIGGMAAVYEATHRMGRRDAIKILHPYIAVSKELRARFEQEAHAVSKLDHPRTVKVIDIDVMEDGAPFMVMELLEGESLGQRAARAPVGEQEMLGYVAALLDVLAAAHAAGIVHRDIKPDNLFITREGELKVLDFGIARMKEGGSAVHTRTGAMLGTTSYMAPEQIHGVEIDGRADIYAVGATMFRVLAQRRVHEAESDAELLIKMGSSPAPQLASVAPGLDARVARIVDRALCFDRDGRYPDAASMLADVRSVMAGGDAVVASGPVSGPRSVKELPGVVALGPTRVARAAPPLAAQAAIAMALEPTVASSSRPDRRPPIAVLVGAGAGLVALLGIVVLIVLLAGGKKKKASDADEEDERPARSKPAAAMMSTEPTAESAAPEDEEELEGPKKGKGPKKKKKHGRGPPRDEPERQPD